MINNTRQKGAALRGRGEWTGALQKPGLDCYISCRPRRQLTELKKKRKKKEAFFRLLDHRGEGALPAACANKQIAADLF